MNPNPFTLQSMDNCLRSVSMGRTKQYQETGEVALDTIILSYSKLELTAAEGRASSRSDITDRADTVANKTFATSQWQTPLMCGL